jgi:hypothetical protein
MKRNLSTIGIFATLLVLCSALKAERVAPQQKATRQPLSQNDVPPLFNDTGAPVSLSGKKKPAAPAGKAPIKAVRNPNLDFELLTDKSVPADAELESAISEDLLEKPSATPPSLADPAEKGLEANAQAQLPLPSPVEPPLSLVDSFSSEKNPGKGTLTYKRVDQNEVIDLGAESGVFGFGLVFRSSVMPEQFIREYGPIDVIQFAFGNLPSKASGRIPEFGTMAVFSRNKPSEWKPYPLAVGGQRQPGQEFGIILFTSPKALAARSDEERLRDSFFSKSGQVRLKSSGSTHGLDVDAQGKKVSFKAQAMKLELDAELSTPFNAQKHQISGAVEVPVYWPESPAALSWMRKIALQSLLASNTVSSPRANASSADQEGSQNRRRRKLPKGM